MAQTGGDDFPADFEIEQLVEPGTDTDSDSLASESLQQNSNRRTTDLVRLYLQEIGRVQLLRRDEEVSEAQTVQRYIQLLELRNESAEKESGPLQTYVRLMDARDRLTSHLGHRPSLERWAHEGGVELFELKPILAEGKRLWSELASLSVKELEHLQSEGLRAKEHMIKANLRLVVSVAKKYQNRGLELLDLIQEGTLGLERAVRNLTPLKDIVLVPTLTGGFGKALPERSPLKAAPFACPFISPKNLTRSRRLSVRFPRKKEGPPPSKISPKSWT